MQLHADFTQTVILCPEDYHWTPSPGGQVNRVMLERIGQERARATSLVEYPQGANFPSHDHPLGEEILVLSGIFTENDQQHYAQGWYLRNPHQSQHQPSSATGCIIFVKLMQMQATEQTPVRINTHDASLWVNTRYGLRLDLYQDPYENTYLFKPRLAHPFSLSDPQGVELLIVQGALHTHKTVFTQGTWLRLAAHDQLHFTQSDPDTILYLKRGHLLHAMHLWQKTEAGSN